MPLCVTIGCMNSQVDGHFRCRRCLSMIRRTENRLIKAAQLSTPYKPEPNQLMTKGGLCHICISANVAQVISSMIDDPEEFIPTLESMIEYVILEKDLS